MRRERRHDQRLLVASRGALALATAILVTVGCARHTDQATSAPPGDGVTTSRAAAISAEAHPHPVRVPASPGAAGGPPIDSRGPAEGPGVPTPSPSAIASSSLAPVAPASGGPASPTPLPPSPAPAVATATAVPLLGPHDPPQIIDISLAPTTIGSGDTVVASATTSSNVASVEARVQNLPNGMQLAANMEKVGVGKFAMHYAIPSLPWYAHGNYTVLVIARNVDGASATRTVSITVR